MNSPRMKSGFVSQNMTVKAQPNSGAGSSHNHSRQFFSSMEKPDQSKQSNHQGCDLVTGSRPDNLRRGAEKFVGEAEQSIRHQVNVEMLFR